MNEIIKSLYDRKSVRVYEDRPIPEKMKQIILEAAAQAPSAGCQQLYTILDITDQKLKDELVKTCDNQPFIRHKLWMFSPAHATYSVCKAGTKAIIHHWSRSCQC